jgi:hypothetical protein
MTRRDFELIASTIRSLRPFEAHDAERSETVAHAVRLTDVVDRLATALHGTNPRFDRQRFFDAAMPLKRIVYVASAWWNDSDPFVTIVGNDPKKVERAAYSAMKDTATDAYNSSEPEDKRKVRDFLDDIGWSGVNTFAFDAIIPHDVIAQYEADENGTVAHYPGLDYLDYQQLRDGERDAIVYL